MGGPPHEMKRNAVQSTTHEFHTRTFSSHFTSGQRHDLSAAMRIKPTKSAGPHESNSNILATVQYNSRGIGECHITSHSRFSNLNFMTKMYLIIFFVN